MVTAVSVSPRWESTGGAIAAQRKICLLLQKDSGQGRDYSARGGIGSLVENRRIMQAGELLS